MTGIILKQSPIGEYDRRICLLTKEKGKEFLMNKKVSILTLSALLLNTLGVSEVFAQRQNRFRGRTGFVKKIVVPNKTIENSDFKASTGLVTNVTADTTIPGDTTTPDDTTPPGDGTNNEDNTNPEDKENGGSSDIGIDTEDNVSPEAVAKFSSNVTRNILL